MATLETQYLNYLKDNPQATLSFQEWLEFRFPPPSDGLRPLDEYKEELGHWDATLMDGLEEEPPYVSDDFQIGPDGAYEHIEYSIPIYENGIKTEYTVDGIVGDEKYYQLLELGNGKDLPDMINVTTKK
jgi:hypothetical protein